VQRYCSTRRVVKFGTRLPPVVVGKIGLLDKSGGRPVIPDALEMIESYDAFVDSVLADFTRGFEITSVWCCQGGVRTVLLSSYVPEGSSACNNPGPSSR
jgi:hypothetical protein